MNNNDFITLAQLYNPDSIKESIKAFTSLKNSSNKDSETQKLKDKINELQEKVDELKLENMLLVSENSETKETKETNEIISLIESGMITSYTTNIDHFGGATVDLTIAIPQRYGKTENKLLEDLYARLGFN